MGWLSDRSKFLFTYRGIQGEELISIDIKHTSLIKKVTVYV